MTNTFNIYCDESAHLPGNHQPLMVLGATWCDIEETRAIAERIRDLKIKHGLKSHQEIKWTKVSKAKLELYIELVDYFFDIDAFRFRALLIRDKDRLAHSNFDQDHDTWYYKMYFSMLKVIITPKARFRIYLDIKDSQSAAKVRKLQEVLCNNVYDFDHSIVERVQTVRSNEVEQLQITDLLVGAIRFANLLSDDSSEAKKCLVERIRKRSGYSLTKSTLLREEKFNLFFWEPREAVAHV